MKTFAKFVIITAFVASCSSNKQAKDGLVCIDVKGNYPEKKILLTDIADITYLHLSTGDEDYLYKGYEEGQRGGISDFKKNTVVVADAVSGSILFSPKMELQSRALITGDKVQENICSFLVM